MGSFADLLNPDRTIALVSIVLSFWISYFFYRRSLENKRIVLGTVGPLPLVETAPVDGLMISYRGTTIPALYRHFLLIWSRGNEPVEASDFASTLRIDDPLGVGH